VAFPLRTRADTRPPPATTSSDGDEYEVESILAKRGKGARTEYLVRWKEWPIWEATWERRKNLEGAVEMLDAFESNLQVNLLDTLDPNRIAGSRGHEYLRLAKFHTLTAFDKGVTRSRSPVARWPGFLEPEGRSHVTAQSPSFLTNLQLEPRHPLKLSLPTDPQANRGDC